MIEEVKQKTWHSIVISEGCRHVDMMEEKCALRNRWVTHRKVFPLKGALHHSLLIGQLISSLKWQQLGKIHCHGKLSILMVFTRKDRDFPWRFVSLPEGITTQYVTFQPSLALIQV